MAVESPPFQEADRCDVCKCSFSTFRRRHHCRSCGRTLCHEHSSNQMALPRFGIYANVRVCRDCFNDSARPEKVDPQTSSEAVTSVTEEVSRLVIGAESDVKIEPATQLHSTPTAVDCRCGMPLCICEAPAPTTDATASQTKPASVYTPLSNPKPKRTDIGAKIRGSTSSNRPSSVFNHSQISNGATDKPLVDYEVNGEGLREAIKNADNAAVKKLLNEGVDANYRDKQGMSLLHLAALFNRTDIAFTLMDSGASLGCKNAQGETPMDCAPATLQYKMKQKMEESGP